MGTIAHSIDEREGDLAPPPAPDRLRHTEEDLVGRLRSGDPAAFECLVRQHAGRMLAVARRFLRCEDDARDAVQEACLMAFRAIERFEGASSLGTWLHRIVVNAALMRLRSPARQREGALDELLPSFDETGHHTTSIDVWPCQVERACLREEVRGQVRAAIDRLPESHRTVLLLRDIEELSTEEAAQILGITPNATKIRLHRARQALRTLLEPVFTHADAE